MELSDIQFIFNRALTHTFDRKKLLGVSFVLMLCGLMVVFFKAIALHASQWVAMSLTFLPIFLCAGVLVGMGIVLIRIYHDKIKKKEINYWKTIYNSWDILLGTAYLSIPIILTYLLLWMILGIFLLLNDIPSVGSFFGVILAFAPFLLNVASLLLCLISLSMLYFITPAVALKGLNRIELSQLLAERFHKNSFFNLVLATIAATPLLLVSSLLTLAAFITGSMCLTCDQPLYTVLQWFFIMVPFTMLLSPATIFFFNFSAESHVLLQKQKA